MAILTEMHRAALKYEFNFIPVHTYQRMKTYRGMKMKVNNF